MSGFSRSSTRRILPLEVFGSSSTNEIARGYLYGAVTDLTCSCSSAASSPLGLVPLAEHDERLDELAAIRVGHADDGALGDRRMLEERALDLERADAVGRGEDHVVRSADEPEVALLVADGTIARHVPAVAERRVRVVGRLPVAGEERRRTTDQREIALLPRSAHVTRVVDHRDVVPGRREAHRARSDRRLGGVRDEQRVLRLPVAVVDRQPERVLEPLDHLGVERLARGDGVAEPGQVRPCEAVELREHPVLGRRLAEDGDAELLEERETLLRLERALVEDDLGAVRPRPEEDVPDRLRPAGAGRAPDDVVLVRVEPVARLHALRPRVGVRVDDALRILRRPRGVEDQRRLAGRRVLGGRNRHVAGELVAGLVEVEHGDGAVDLVAHLLDLDLARALRDHESRARMTDPEREVARAEHVGAGNRDETALERAEHGAVPGGALAEHHEHAIAAIEARPQQVRPARGVTGDLGEAPAIDDALGVDEGERRPRRVVGERVDDVAREVEATGNLPRRARTTRRAARRSAACGAGASAVPASHAPASQRSL